MANYTVSQNVSFTYKGHKVKGIIKSINDKYIVVNLTEQYAGKNVDWDKGEDKVCYLSLIKPTK